jgi:sulfite exporter TauE/SafE
MSAELSVLLGAAITVACLHTAVGPDHYLPFIALSRSRGWSLWKTVFWTIVCGCGHVWSSVALGLGGAALGWSLSKIRGLENVRGGMAAWAMLGFGLIYGIWGLIRAGQDRRHKHFDVYEDGSVYVYEHSHGEVVRPRDRHKVTPWVLLIVFALGPCEPMIPLLFFPAAQHSWLGMGTLILVYTVFTLATMTLMVLSGYFGLRFLRTDSLERYIHALGGLTLFLCGVGMVCLGW